MSMLTDKKRTNRQNSDKVLQKHKQTEDKAEANNASSLHQVIRMMRAQISRLTKENAHLTMEKGKLMKENEMLVSELMSRLKPGKSK
ncbi:hypothetical protein [Photobacterium sp. TY1-4]|uniref:hypothetical protein n=1 Tax=Photobacterium sp. TY1-4 TaxID=2899122 RepID=UPI0021BFA83C|nr:hypothetical protein [Photobacterium sp. TY1-4]UXI01126.1 hypothetical protein NH461_15385 [Photobacterium sp. TY1-4]